MLDRYLHEAHAVTEWLEQGRTDVEVAKVVGRDQQHINAGKAIRDVGELDEGMRGVTEEEILRAASLGRDNYM